MCLVRRCFRTCSNPDELTRLQPRDVPCMKRADAPRTQRGCWLRTEGCTSPSSLVVTAERTATRNPAYQTATRRSCWPLRSTLTSRTTNCHCDPRAASVNPWVGGRADCLCLLCCCSHNLRFQCWNQNEHRYINLFTFQQKEQLRKSFSYKSCMSCTSRPSEQLCTHFWCNVLGRLPSREDTHTS